MGWERGVTKVEVVDRDVAPVCDLSVSIAGEKSRGSRIHCSHMTHHSLPRTCTVPASYLQRSCPVLAPYLHHTGTVLAPYLHRTCTVPAPYLHRTCTDTEPVVKPLGLLLEGFEDNGKRASRRDPFVGRNRIWGSSSP